MSKKVLVISSSPRVGGNSDVLADAFVQGAIEAGNEAEKVNLAGKKIEFCRGCFVCQSTQRCVIRDDADQIEQKMQDADILVFATPIYYYEMSGQLKTMLDRGNPLYTTDYKFRMYISWLRQRRKKSLLQITHCTAYRAGSPVSLNPAWPVLYLRVV